MFDADNRPQQRPGGTEQHMLGQKFPVQRKNKWKTAHTYVSFMLTLTWMLKGRLRKPHWVTSLSTNGVLAACLHRSQCGISEEFLISTHQDLSSGDSSSYQRRLNQHGGGGRAQVRGSTRNRTDKSELPLHLLPSDRGMAAC